MHDRKKDILTPPGTYVDISQHLFSDIDKQLHRYKTVWLNRRWPHDMDE